MRRLALALALCASLGACATLPPGGGPAPTPAVTPELAGRFGLAGAYNIFARNLLDMAAAQELDGLTLARSKEISADWIQAQRDARTASEKGDAAAFDRAQRNAMIAQAAAEALIPGITKAKR